MKPPDLTNRAPNTHPEKGQTIAIVAAAMMGVLIMATLAIDLATLYVAHGEIQRAADAAALAGAKAFVDSGMTTATTNPSQANLQAVATAMAGDYAKAVAAQNNVAGAPAAFMGAQINVNAPGNPTIQVTLQRTDLPLFFGRIWGTSIASVSATAIAEAYNPAYSPAGGFIPSAPKCVKPFLVPNNSQFQPTHPVFVDPATGAVNAAASSFIGETLKLTSACGSTPGVCSPSGQPAAGQYLPMYQRVAHQYCPSPSAGTTCSDGNDFERSTKCCDGVVFDFFQCGVSGTIATWDSGTNPGGPGGPAQNGLQCLIHGTPTKAQQDTLNFSQPNVGPLQIQAGPYSQAQYGVALGSVISTSSSVIMVPLFDNRGPLLPNQQVTIVGFLQLFVKSSGVPLGPNAPDMDAIILNVIGCGSTLGATSAISGGGASAIPVRLIHN
jgi:hypothetical protein